MSETRFNLQQLREQAQEVLARLATNDYESTTAKTLDLIQEERASAVLALVDAVEAAHRVAAMEQDYSSHEEVIDDEGAPCPQCVKWRGTMDDLEAALTQFSFEEPA